MEKLCANGKEKEERQKEIADRIKDIETALSVYCSPKAAGENPFVPERHK